jgi:DNA repair photolyase
MSKIIYRPKGKAGEYAKYAANFYTGCTGRCEYCYNRTGITAKVLGGDKPELKKCLGTVENAEQIFMQEADMYRIYLMKHGLFFNFVSDPFLPETIGLNEFAMRYCFTKEIPVKVLTKQTWWIEEFLAERWENETIWNYDYRMVQKFMAIGFTLTGHDEQEPGCAPNSNRILAMKHLHEAGFKTWASIEPIIDFDSSFRMIEQVAGHCDLYKIGLQSGKKYDKEAIQEFTLRVMAAARCNHTKVYFKDSLVSMLRATREEMSQWQWGDCLVAADYNMFEYAEVR